MVILSRSSNTRILCMYKVLAYFPSIFILHILWRWYSFIFLIDFLLLGFWLDMYIFFSYSYSKLDDIKSHIQYCTNDDAPQKIDYGKVYPEEVIYYLGIYVYKYIFVTLSLFSLRFSCVISIAKLRSFTKKKQYCNKLQKSKL